MDKTPLSAEELKNIAEKAGFTVAQLVNTKSKTFRDIKPELASLGEEEVINLLQEYPRLLLRPILLDGNRIRLGFKEAAYQEFINS